MMCCDVMCCDDMRCDVLCCGVMCCAVICCGVMWCDVPSLPDVDGRGDARRWERAQLRASIAVGDAVMRALWWYSGERTHGRAKEFG